MKMNIPRVLAWLLLTTGAVGAPLAARLGRSVPPNILRWLLTIGVALMIISFFWFPRRGGASVDRSVGRSAATGRAARR